MCMHMQAHLRGQRGGLWDTESLGELAAVATQQSQVAKELVREVTNYWLAYYFQAEMEADPNRIWKVCSWHILHRTLEVA